MSKVKIPEIHLSPKSRSRVKLLPSRKLIITSLVVVVVSLVSLGGFSFLRHQQLCSYQGYVVNGTLVSDSRDLCPNLFDSGQWGQIIGNAFNLSLPASLKVADNFTDEHLAPQVAVCDDILNPLCWVSNAPQLAQTDGFTNLLLVGIDQRNGLALQNTDTIMMVSYDHTQGRALFISFPRDLYLDYVRPMGYPVTYKINAVYSIDGIPGLNGVVQQTTGRPIHYYAYINLDLFVQLIDKIGGVDVVIPEAFTELYPCPEMPPGIPCNQTIRKDYGTIEFAAGPMHLDYGWAQIYVRARQITLDYGRARRQQQVLQAIITKIQNDERSLAEKLGTYVDLYNLFRSQVQTNIELKDLAGVFNLVSKMSSSHASVVLDQDLDQGRIVHYLGVLPGVGWSIGFYDRSHDQLRSYLNNVSTNIAFYTETPQIKILVNPQAQNVPDIAAAIGGGMSFVTIDNDDPWLSEIDKLAGIRIYDFSGGEKSASIKELQSRLPGSRIYSPAIDGVTRSEWGEEITIIVGL